MTITIRAEYASVYADRIETRSEWYEVDSVPYDWDKRNDQDKALYASDHTHGVKRYEGDIRWFNDNDPDYTPESEVIDEFCIDIGIID
jgi:hypothetical protein